jgi:putative NAD(P)H nitroreductase
MNFLDLSLKRRSVNFFKKDVVIDNMTLNKIIDLAQFCPSASNTQPWKLVIVKNEEKKSVLRECAFGQPKVTDASAVFILLGDKEAYKKENPSYKNFIKNGYMTEEEFEGYIKMIEGLYSGLQSPDSFAIRNASLFGMALMYSAEFFGWQTHPMIGYNPKVVSEKFNIPERYIPVMLIAIGKFDDSKTLLKRNERLTMNDFCEYDTFKEKTDLTFKNIFADSKKVTLKGNEQKLVGINPEIGKKAPVFDVINNNLEKLTIGNTIDKPIIISSVPSLDTPVCSLQTKKFNDFLMEYKDKIDFMTISCDTPFAQQRFCTTEKIDFPAYSDYSLKNFSINYGVLISDLNLCARAVFIIGKNGILKYKQIVAEISEEPDYNEVIENIKSIIS